MRLNLRAAACQFGGHYAEAVAGYNQAQTLAPEQFTGFINRGQCYQALGKHRKAIADFDEVVRRYPDASDGYLFRGGIQIGARAKAEAKQDFDLVFENTSMVISASIRIGCLLIDSGLPDEGLPWLDKVLAENPDNAQALECRARAK
ncbi:MAG: tetratricopeptide repeat protein [Lewinellaceae bacterium]|nr:tetratricopeptide repeat protein [Lewinellaceae bacterium]